MSIHEPALPVMAAPPGPAITPAIGSAQERSSSLDVLRGAAVLGILLVNIYSFALPEMMRIEPLLLPQYSAFEQWCWYFIAFFADTKFIALLSLAFGAGLWLFAVDKQSLPTPELNRLQWRRNLSLLVLGAAHAYLLWNGDVLVIYALFSLVVWRWRLWRDDQLILAALLAFACQTVLYGGMYWLPADTWQELSYKFDESALQEEIAHYQQGWWQQASRRFYDALGMQLVTVFGGWFPCSMMLFGVVLARRGYFSNMPPVNTTAMMLVSLLVGATLMLLVLLLNSANGFTSKYSLTLGMQAHMCASGLLAIGYALLFVRWANSGLWPLGRRVLAAVGRMALSMYIMQTLLFTGIFYGYGLGLYGQLALSQLLVLVMAVWLLQCGIAVLWLRYFYSGPLEWLWRWVIYQRVQPFRRPS